MAADSEAVASLGDPGPKDLGFIPRSKIASPDLKSRQGLRPLRVSFNIRLPGAHSSGCVDFYLSTLGAYSCAYCSRRQLSATEEAEGAILKFLLKLR